MTSEAVCKMLADCADKSWGGSTYNSGYAYGCVRGYSDTYYLNTYNSAYSYCSSSYPCICGDASTTVSQDGYGTSATFNRPSGIALSSDGSKAYVADTYNHRIRVIILETREVRTLVGSSSGWQDGYEATAQFNTPFGVVVIPDARRERRTVPRIVTSAAGCGTAIVTSASVCEQLAFLVPEKGWSGAVYSASRPPGCFAYGTDVYFNSMSSPAGQVYILTHH